MMLAEVKLVMDSKIAGDKEKGEETPTTKTKCVRGAMRDACAVTPLLTRLLAACSVFEKTYTYVKRFSYPNATAETVQSIRECVRSASPSAHSRRVTRTLSLCPPQPHALTLPAPPRCRVLAQRGLHEFEVCALGNLAPSNAEEAKALAPSLDLPIDLQLIPEARVACRARERCAHTTD
jgi:hypothetical protein